MKLTSTATLPGYDIVAVCGFVFGVTARSMNAWAERVKSLADGKTRPVDELIGLMRDARYSALEALQDEAARLGANAVVGVAFDHRNLSPAWVDVCAYGTAVMVRPTGEAPPPPRPRRSPRTDDVA